MKRIVILILLFLIPLYINSQPLSDRDIRFAAQYIIYLEKKSKLQSEIISSQERQIQNYILLGDQRDKIEFLKERQLEMYKGIALDLKSLNINGNKKFYEQPWFFLGLGFALGNIR